MRNSIHARRRLTWIGMLMLLWVPLTWALAAAPASAHAALVSSTPADGQKLAAMPKQVSFTFNEPMQSPAYVIVTAPDGSSVTTGKPQVSTNTISQEIKAGPAGPYTMAYRAISKDGHPVTGKVTFQVGEATTSADGSGAAKSGASKQPSAAAQDNGATAGSSATAADPETGPSERTKILVAVAAVLAGGAVIGFFAARGRPE